MQEISISLKPEVIATVGDFPITNSLWVSFLVTTILIVVFARSAAKQQKIPGKWQVLLEAFVSGCYSLVKSTVGSEHVAKKAFPLFATLVAFFLLSNLLGLLPIWSAFSVSDVPLYRPATADYTLVFTITALMFILWQVVIIVSGGLWHFLKTYKNPLDIIGEFAKVISLSFRLFGNIFAGEVIATIMISLVPYFAPIPFAFLGLLSSVVQAIVFPFLVIIFMNMAIAVPKKVEKEMKKQKKVDQKVPQVSG